MNEAGLDRRTLLKGAAMAAGAMAWAGAGPAIAGRRRPNVLMIVADDQRHDTIRALGNGHISTPALDRLAREGFALTNARCMGAQQGAVCVPARAMILSGRTLFRAPEQLPAEVAILPQLFRQAGYTTFGCGKWHNGSASFARGFNSGGNIFFGGMHNQYNTPVNDFEKSGKYPRARPRPGGEFSSQLFADAAEAFLEKPGDAPFFCYLAFTSPHDPRTSPPPFNSMYRASEMPLPANFLPEHPFDNGELRIRDELLAPFPRTPGNTRQQLCDYYGMISSQDAQVMRLLQALEKAGRLDETIVIYTGDHGLAIGSHGLFGKQNVYEHSVRVPMLIRGPGVGRGQSDAMVYGFDLLPTLCEMAGIEVPSGVEGQSLGAVMRGEKMGVRDSGFHAYIKPAKVAERRASQLAQLDGRWKLIEYTVHGQLRHQLFDLAADASEMHDLSADPAAAGELARMRELMRRSARGLGWEG